jgi:hypothetical protein
MKYLHCGSQKIVAWLTVDRMASDNVFCSPFEDRETDPQAVPVPTTSSSTPTEPDSPMRQSGLCMRSSKDQTIVDLLSRTNLQGRDWEVVDYWEADLCAIGIRSRFDLGRLVYVSTFRKSPGLFDYECEGPDQEGAPFSAIKSGRDVGFGDLLDVMIKHLS